MDEKDRLGFELRSIMDEDAIEINLSPHTIEEILSHRKKGLKERIIDLLNKEIEIPVATIIVFSAFLILVSIPKDIFQNNNIQIIEIGSSQVIISEKEGGRK